MSEEKKLSLTKIEETLIISLQARERELFREVLQPLQDAFKQVLNDIEVRLGLNAGDVGSKFNLDQENWTLVPASKDKNETD
jgi:hypothetical protein